MSVVIDNSMALAWVVSDERSAASDAILDRVARNGGYVPYIFVAELSNGLTMAVRRHRITSAERLVAFDRITKVMKVFHDLEGLNRSYETIELADRHDLTFYDALYLELAIRMRLPMATFDKKLARAARQAGVALILSEA